MIRFNEAIDQELAESVNFYTDRVAHSRELVVAMLSHDLRSPLQGITLATELSLNMGDLSDRQTMLAKKVLESTDRMGALIKRFVGCDPGAVWCGTSRHTGDDEHGDGRRADR